MKKLVTLVAAAALALASGAVFGQGTTASHSVTVDVQAINEISITGGNITLTIDSATAGSDPDAATDSTTSLSWSTNEATKKITVATTNGTPTSTLTVEATSVTGGTTAGTVTPSTTAADFVTGISTTNGGATLSYSASTTSANGTGTDTHTITYTITAG